MLMCCHLSVSYTALVGDTTRSALTMPLTNIFMWKRTKRLLSSINGHHPYPSLASSIYNRKRAKNHNSLTASVRKAICRLVETHFLCILKN